MYKPTHQNSKDGRTIWPARYNPPQLILRVCASPYFSHIWVNQFISSVKMLQPKCRQISPVKIQMADYMACRKNGREKKKQKYFSLQICRYCSRRGQRKIHFTSQNTHVKSMNISNNNFMQICSALIREDRH